LRLIAGPDRSSDPPAALINQDARMYAAVLPGGVSIDYTIRPARHAWVQCATGAIDVNGVALKEGDGLAVSDEPALRLRGSSAGDAELLLFDLA
jgi:redox-sensitive bicupin YhaK (pirin superfamily)